MSAARLLILGVLQFRSPVHGYDIRRELESWSAERWAHVAYGSIYFALNKMAEEGLVATVGAQQIGHRPARTLYTLTEKGRTEFDRLLREYWWEPKPATDPFQVALVFMNKLPHDELVAALRARIGQLRVALETFAYFEQSERWQQPTEIPRHVVASLRRGRMHMEADLRWLEEILAQVERGELP